MRSLLMVMMMVAASISGAAASDATWFCSAMMGKPNVPMAFKFVVTGGVLAAAADIHERLARPLEDNRLLDEFYQPKSGKDEPMTTKYNIVEDSNIGLVAVHPEHTDDPSHPIVTADIIVINKTSGALIMEYLTTKERSNYYEGTCQVGK